MDHWRRGHKQICKRIHRGGNAEQYYADKKYKEAVAVAVEKCAADTKGQTCFICTQALHWKTKEGLVRGCACRGTAGFAHVSCLAEQVKILFAEAEDNNLDEKVQAERFVRWYECSMCKQHYHGVVRCALGWACWKTYLGRPEWDGARVGAINVLGNGLYEGRHDEDALSVGEAELSMLRRIGGEYHGEKDMRGRILATLNNLGSSYNRLGRFEEAVNAFRDVYSGYSKLLGEEHIGTLSAANNYANSLIERKHFKEARSLLRKTIPVARRSLGSEHKLTLKIRSLYALTLYADPSATLDDLRKAVMTLEDADRTARRVFGGSNPVTTSVEHALRNARATLRARETPSPPV